MTTRRMFTGSRRAGSLLAVAAIAAIAGCGSGDSPQPQSTRAAATDAVVHPKPAAPPAVDANGSIVYQKEIRGDIQLFSVRADGTGERQLTDVEGEAVSPDWSPDSSRIVFQFNHTHEEHQYCSIALVNADGSGLTDLGKHERDCDGAPSFTPDGQRIVFGHFDEVKDTERILTMDTSGGDRRVIKTPSRWAVVDPEMSPDGDWISFVRLKEADQNSLYVMRPDGSQLRRLTPDSWEISDKHAWSPDGKLITLTIHAHELRPGQSANAVTLRPDGSIATRLTRLKGAMKNAFAGSFSPDGKQIVLRLENGDESSLAVVDRDGRNLRRLTEPGTDKARYIDWGPGATQPQTQVTEPPPEAVSGGGED